MSTAEQPKATAVDPVTRDLVEVAGVRWPTELLHRASAEVLTQLARTFTAAGLCCVCSTSLGPPPWVARVGAAAGPFGAWVARGDLAHPCCIAPETVLWDVSCVGKSPTFAPVVEAGIQPFPSPCQLSVSEDERLFACPIIAVIPAPASFLIGRDPGSRTVEDKVLRRFLDMGWHRLAGSVLDGTAVDGCPPRAVMKLSGRTVSIETVDGDVWQVEVNQFVATLIRELGYVVVLVGVDSVDTKGSESLLCPGSLYGFVRGVEVARQLSGFCHLDGSGGTWRVHASRPLRGLGRSLAR